MRPSMMGTSDDFKRRLEVEKENFRKIKSKAQTINFKEVISSSKNRFKIVNAISKSRDLKANDNKTAQEDLISDVQNE